MTPETEFDEIYSAHVQEVYHTCLRAVSLPEVAESLTSDVFVALHAEWPESAGEQLHLWLSSAAQRFARDYWKQQALGHSWSSVPWRASLGAADPQFSLEDLLDRCSALKPVHRICLILRFRHDMPRATIAARTGMSELQVKGHLQQGLRLLQSDAALADKTDAESLISANAQPGLCPSPELLFAAEQDVLPTAMGVAVRDHGGRCALCITLLEGLAPAATELTPGQDARIHERLMAALQPEEFADEFGAAGNPVWRLMGPVVVVVLLAIGSVTSYRLIHHSVRSPQPSTAIPTSAPAPARQDIPEMHTVTPLLVADGPDSAALGPTLRLYDQGNFGAAAADLVPLAARNPKSDAPLLYLGISQLQLGENVAAQTTLTRALELATPAHQPEATWFLAVAELRTGEQTAALRRLQALCPTTSSHAPRACVLAAQLATTPG